MPVVTESCCPNLIWFKLSRPLYEVRMACWAANWAWRALYRSRLHYWTEPSLKLIFLIFLLCHRSRFIKNWSPKVPVLTGVELWNGLKNGQSPPPLNFLLVFCSYIMFIFIYLFIYFSYLIVCMWEGAYGLHCMWGGQRTTCERRVSPPTVSLGLNSGSQAWWQRHLYQLNHLISSFIY